MKTPSSAVLAMWTRYLATLGEEPTTSQRSFSTDYFCDNPIDADCLAKLVLDGKKTATASAHATYDVEGEVVPVPGSSMVVTDWSGAPQCIIETISVDIVPFSAVSPDFAAAEGEGDGTLEYWRRVHWEFWSRELPPLGLTPSEDMLVVCERFKVVFR